MKNRIITTLFVVFILGTYNLVLCQCPPDRFGEFCDYTCHCLEGTECDPKTGECSSGCAAGWSAAPYCQAENVALNKVTYQHGTYLGWNSTRAVDGNRDQDGTYGSCAWAHNDDDVFKTWWNVDLEAFYYIHSLEIFFRTDDANSQSRRAGIRVYVSDSIEEAKNEGLCYMDQMTDFVFPPAHLVLGDGSFSCTKRDGRFVILYVDRPAQTPIRNCPTGTLYSCWANLELCEVEIYANIKQPGQTVRSEALSVTFEQDGTLFANGSWKLACTNGTYGRSCEKHCHCEDNVRCNALNGACPGRCAPGWESETCNLPCMSGRYGIDCNRTCGQCLDTATSCDRITGECAPCQAGWKGAKCDIPCEAGTYGMGCSETCGNCIGVCNPQSGMCSLGCKDGWIGSKCTEACGAGYYGPSCASKCGYCLNGAVCDHQAGKCPTGCMFGYIGIRCDKVCPPRTFGEGCSTQCGACNNGATCDHITGECPGGCSDGWTGNDCLQACLNGTYGKDCIGKCGVCLGGIPCDHVTGLCAGGCANGWTGEKCKNRCPPGRFGPKCSNTCGACLNGDACDHVSGVCAGGCSDGWKGDGCKKVCDKGYFGRDCAQACGFCKNKTTCNHIEGLCPQGCAPDYYGEFCMLSLTIPDKTEESAPGKSNYDLSVLIGGIMAGVVVVFIGIMLFVFLRRKRNKPKPTYKASSQRQHTHTNVEIINDDAPVPSTSSRQSPTPSRTSSHNTMMSGSTLQHLSVDDQEVLYVNLKKKTPSTLPIPVPSPKLSSFQRSKMAETEVDGISNGGFTTEPTYYNTKTELTTPLTGVPVAQFNKYVKEKENTKNGYKDEFSQYPHGMKYPHEAGKRPRNKFKNRYAQMFPYDHGRVVLEEDPSEPDSDYINANFIDSVDYPNCYIATQGPNKITLKDFWRMIWQSKSGKIVMLTNLVEETKNKCERYWPSDPSIPMTFGDLQVNIVSTQKLPYFTIRVMTLGTNLVPEDVRTVKQFHFTAWPDHGVPDTFELVSFYKCVLRADTNLPGPMVVHCSAGVGRTGTFIGLDALYHFARRGNNLDIPLYVNKMRQQRMNMIQTLDQYRLLHYALQEMLTYGDTTISKSKFLGECRKHLLNQNSNSTTRICDEFQKLEDLKPKPGNEHYLAALRKENVEKNRSLSVLAADKYRPYLSTYVPDTTDYINAVVVPSRNSKNGFIISQLPMKNTITDFWRLIYDHGSNIILTLNAPDEDQEESCAWWPSLGDSASFGPLVVETLAVDTPLKEVTERTLRLMRKGVKESKLLNMLTFNFWPTGKDLPTSVETFLIMLGRVNSYRRSFGDNPMTVLCLDGATCSGLFIVISNLIDQLQQEEELDICNAVRQIQIRRPQCIKDKDQYMFIYQTINSYTDWYPATCM